MKTVIVFIVLFLNLGFAQLTTYEKNAQDFEIEKVKLGCSLKIFLEKYPTAKITVNDKGKLGVIERFDVWDLKNARFAYFMFHDKTLIKVSLVYTSVNIIDLGGYSEYLKGLKEKLGYSTTNFEDSKDDNGYHIVNAWVFDNIKRRFEIRLNDENDMVQLIITDEDRLFSDLKEKVLGDYGITMYEKELKINPNSAEILNSLALIYIENKQKDKAIACFKKLVHLNEANDDSFSRLIFFLWEAKKDDEAMKYAKEYLRSNPENQLAYTAIVLGYYSHWVTPKKVSKKDKDSLLFYSLRGANLGNKACAGIYFEKFNYEEIRNVKDIHFDLQHPVDNASQAFLYSAYNAEDIFEFDKRIDAGLKHKDNFYAMMTNLKETCSGKLGYIAIKNLLPNVDKGFLDDLLSLSDNSLKKLCNRYSAYIRYLYKVKDEE